MVKEQRSEMMRVKLTPSERARIGEIAERHSMSVSTYVRFVALGGRFGRTAPEAMAEPAREPKGMTDDQRE